MNGYRAIVAGATGAVGSALVHEPLASVSFYPCPFCPSCTTSDAVEELSVVPKPRTGS